MRKYGEGCEGCIYWRKLVNAQSSTKACNYCLDTGKLRGCDAGEGCLRYTEGKKKTKKAFKAEDIL